MTLRIGVSHGGGEGWLGGQTYLANLLSALHATYADAVTLILMWDGAAADVPAEFGALADEIVNWPSSARRWTIQRAVGGLTRRLAGYDPFGAWRIKASRIDLLLLRNGRDSPSIPSFTVIPDFQHRRHPEFFTELECRGRDRSFEQEARLSSRVLLFGASVMRDYRAYLPQYSDKGRILAPVSYVPESAYESEPRSLLSRYNLPEKFVYLPGQFWKHKNHMAAFEALKNLKQRGTRVFFVSTGHSADYRHPEYYDQVLNALATMGIREQVALLGVVPREQVYALFRQCVCVLCPSLFEGFGLAVDEARSFGKRIVLSNIEAHVEQNPPNAFYFDPLDPEALANQLERVWLDTPAGPDRALEERAREEQPGRVRACADSFMRIAHEVIP